MLSTELKWFLRHLQASDLFWLRCNYQVLRLSDEPLLYLSTQEGEKRALQDS